MFGKMVAVFQILSAHGSVWVPQRVIELYKENRKSVTNQRLFFIHFSVKNPQQVIVICDHSEQQLLFVMPHCRLSS